MKHRTIQFLTAGVLGLFALGFGQDNYSQWSHYRVDTVNTTASGANVTSNQLFYPMLLRLNSGNFVFSSALGGGRDLRFSKNNGTHLPYQIESWDSAGQSASVWVLLDTVYGNNKTTFKMYYGKSGAVDSSRGDIVFSTLNNYQGVFHLGEVTGDTARDATGNRFKGIPQNRGGLNPVDTAGLIGHAKSFLGNNNNNNGGSYRLATSTGGSTFTGNALNFQNDSSTINGLPLYTISLWMNVSEFPTGTNNRKGVIAKSRGVNGQQFHFRLLDPAIDQVNTPVGDTMRLDFADGPTAVYKRGDHRLTPWTSAGPTLVPGTWHHVAAVRTGPVGTPANLRVLVDGVFACSSSTSLTQTTRSDFDVTIGSFSNDSGFFNGKLDEVEFSNTARSDDWVKLSYGLQKPGATLGVGAEQTPPSGITYRTNPLTLTTNVAMGADSVIAVSGSVTGYSVSPALPAGLSLNTTNGILSGTPTAAQGATAYTVTATGPGGTGTVTVTITINAPPAITTNPANVTVTTAVNSGKFWVVASGTSPFTYKWIRTRTAGIDTLTNTGIFTTSTTDTLRFTNAVRADSASTFKCMVSNGVGSVVSTAATLTVNTVVGILGPYVVHVKGLSPFSFRVPENGVTQVRMSAEDMMGRVVWAKDLSLAKSRVVSWNGSGRDGHAVSSGMYVVRMKMLANGNTVGESTQAGVK